MSGFEGSAGAAPPEPRAQAGRGGSIWVDDTLLACANHAFDVALTHRAGEVRLEHLLYALTRVEAAAAALEARGVRVVPLRRDAAMVIASEIPIGLGGTGGNPRRSPELEETLRHAAAHAARAGRPASVEHVLHVLIDLRSDLPGTELLLRYLPRASRDFWSSPAPARGPDYSGSAQFVDVPETDHMRSPAFADFPSAPVHRPELAAAGAPAVSDEMLARLAHIEQILSERLAALETALTSAPPAAPADLRAIKDRLDVIEEAVLAREGDGALSERLSALVRMLQEERAERASALSGLTAEVKALASTLGSGNPEGEALDGPFAKRLQSLAADLEQHRIELGASLGDRIAQIEKALEAQGQKVAESHDAYSEELAEVHEALMKLNVNQHTLSGSIDQWRSTDAGEMHLINARIGAVQEDGVKRLQMLERLCGEVEGLSRAGVEKQPGRSFRYWLFGTDDWIKASWLKRAKPKA